MINHDADIQAPESKKEEQARLPGQDADEGGPQDAESTSPKRAAPASSQSRLEVALVAGARPRSGASSGFGFPPSKRITRSREIRNLLRRGKRKKTSHLDVFFLSSEGSHSRLGVVVPKHRRRIVERNRVKRRLREVGRRDLLPGLQAAGVQMDLLIRARREAYEASYQQLRRELLKVNEELCSGQSSWR